MFAPPTDVVVVLDYLLVLSGLIPLWRYVLSPRARATRATSPLTAWELPSNDFFVFLFAIGAGALLTSFAAGLVLRFFTLPADTKTIISSAAFQLGLLLGPALLPLQLGHHPLRPAFDRATLLSGLATFLIALPVVTLVNLGWIAFLKLTGLPADSQELLRLVSEIDSPGLLALFVVVATVIAPFTEELVFRATLFRYLRTRVPRWFAVLLPATIFATFHFNLPSFIPLLALAVVFSLAYERTGRIATPIIAHGLFNLHTIVLLLAGVTQ